MKKKDPYELTDYHKQKNWENMLTNLLQPPMTREERIEQIKRIREQATKQIRYN